MPKGVTYYRPPGQTTAAKLTVGVDYHGCLCSYTQGKHWEADTISPEGPSLGAIEWLLEVSERFHVAVTCARASQRPEMVDQLCEWLIEHGVPRSYLTLSEPSSIDPRPRIWVSQFKPRCWLYIDDRAFCFRGTWPAVAEIEQFRPWNR